MLFDSTIIRKSVLIECDDKKNDIEFIESNGWEDEGKWQSQEYIFKHNGKFYSVTDSRSGSYYSDYYYESREDWGDTIECDEVKKVKVTTHTWVAVDSEEEVK